MSDIGIRGGSTAAQMLRETMERNVSRANGGAVVESATVTHEQGCVLLRNLEAFAVAANLYEQTSMFERSGAAPELIAACMIVVREKQREAMLLFTGVEPAQREATS